MTATYHMSGMIIHAGRCFANAGAGHTHDISWDSSISGLESGPGEVLDEH